MHFHVCAHASEILAKTLQKRSTGIKIRGYGFFAVQVLLDCCFAAPLPYLGASWALLGASWASLGAYLDLLGRSWPPLGPNLEPLGRLLEPTWTLLGTSWTQLGASWAPLGANLDALGHLLGSTRILLASPLPFQHALIIPSPHELLLRILSGPLEAARAAITNRGSSVLPQGLLSAAAVHSQQNYRRRIMLWRHNKLIMNH